MPDDILHKVELLYDLISDARGPDGNELPIRAACLAELDTVLRALQKEWPEAQRAANEYQRLQAKVRGAADDVERQLTLLRRVVAAELGRTSRAYQRLRLRNSQSANENENAEPKAETTPAN